MCESLSLKPDKIWPAALSASFSQGEAEGSGLYSTLAPSNVNW